jgi:hypothetical protein
MQDVIVAVQVGPYIDCLELAHNGLAFGTILHALNNDHDVLDRIALDCELSVDRAHQAGVTAWPRSVYAAMVHDDDNASEGMPDCVRCPDVRRHVFVVGLGAGERAVQCIYHHRDRQIAISL